jgi:hypothetical protein
MNPTPEQLDCWMATHNIDCSRSMQSVVLRANTVRGEPIARVQIAEDVPLFRSNQDYARLEKACNLIADQLCIVSPAAALHLNQKYSQE